MIGNACWPVSARRGRMCRTTRGSLSRIKLIFSAVKLNRDRQCFIAILIVGRGNEYVTNSGVAKCLFHDRLDKLFQLPFFGHDHNPSIRTRLRAHSRCQ